jgi:iron complex outermembrane recepter protein
MSCVNLKRCLFSSPAALLALAVAFPAHAESSDAAGAEKIEAVTVTAQRHEEKAQNVGIALSVFSPEDLAKKNIRTVNDLQYTVPHFEYDPAYGSGQAQFRLRGVGFWTYSSNNASPVNVYVDDVALPVSAMTQWAFFDIARLEVLRGPQGTLYGRNTTGGAVNVITNRPTDAFAAGAQLSYDSHNAMHGEGYVSAPIDNTLKFRLSAFTNQGGAWQKNRETGESLGDKDIAAFRGQLEWTPSARVDVLLQGNWGYDHSEGDGNHLLSAAGGISEDLSPATTSWGGSEVFESLTGIKPTDKPKHNSIMQGVTLNAHVDLGFADLSSITAYNYLHRREYGDWDATAYAYGGTYFNTKAGVFSQEIRLSHSDGPLFWQTGIYYSNEKIDEVFDSDFMDSLGYVTETTYQQHVNAVAAFAQVEYHLTDSLKITGGLRAESELRKQQNYLTSSKSTVASSLSGFGTPVNKRLNSEPLTGKIGIDYKPVENVMLYASISKGVKSGGFTAYNVPNRDALPPAKPETLLAYECGFKSNLFGDSLQFNGTGFYYDYRDQQVQSAIWNPSSGAIGTLINVPKSHIWGVEFDALWHPVPALTLSQSFGYKEGFYDDFKNGLDNTASNKAGYAVYIDRSGVNIGLRPISYMGSLSYTFDFGDYVVEPEFNYDFRSRSKSLVTQNQIGSYWLANANITLTPKSSPWEFTLFGRNLLNQKYDMNTNSFISIKNPGATSRQSVNIALSGEPMTVGGRISFTY